MTDDVAFLARPAGRTPALIEQVTAAYRDPAVRDEVRGLVRTRLDAAVAANRLVTIEESLAKLMLVTPGCRPEDRAVAQAAIARSQSDDERPAAPKKRRFWQRG